MTHETLVDLAWDILGDNKDSPVYFSAADMYKYFNNAARRMVEETTCLQKKDGTTTLVAGTAEYTLPSGARRVNEVALDDERIVAKTTKQIALFDADWREATNSTPILYYLDGLNSKIGLYPPPDAGAAADTLDIFYDAWPTEVDATSEYYEVPEWASYGLICGVLEQAFRSNTELRNMAASMVYGMLFQHYISRLKMRVNGKLSRTWLFYGGGDVYDSVQDGRLPDTIG